MLYLLASGEDGVLVDIGTDAPSALQKLQRTLTDLNVTRLRALLLTHTHPDHCAGAAWVRETFGVPSYAHPLETPPFPILPLTGGETVLGVVVHHTPGHSPGHLSFETTGALLIGDLLAAQGSTWVGLPGGNLRAYLASLESVSKIIEARAIGVLGPGHGPSVSHPLRRLREVRAHRLERETQVLSALRHPLTLADLRTAIYPELPAAALRAADGSLLAQLEKLMYEGAVSQTPEGRYPHTWQQTFARVR